MKKPRVRYRILVLSEETNKFEPLIDGIVTESNLNKILHWFMVPVSWIEKDPHKCIGFGIPEDRLRVEKYIDI